MTTQANQLANKNQKAIIYALLDQLKLKELKDDLVYEFTDMRSTHTSDMTIEEASELIKSLQAELNEKLKPLTGKIIYYLCMFGMKLPNEKPDYKRIDAFIINIGSRNPKKKKLFDLNYTEALSVLNQVQTMIKHEQKRKQKQ